MDLISCHIGNSIGHHCFAKGQVLGLTTPTLRMCVHSLKTYWIVEVSVQVGWKSVCMYVCMCVYVLDVVLEFICSPQCHIEQRFTYELYGAVKRWR